MADYKIYLLTPQNVPADEFTHFAGLDYTLVVNEIAALSLELPGDYAGGLGEDYRLEVYRDGALVGETQFLVTAYGPQLSAEGEFVTGIQAAGALKVLDWPVINYAPGLLQSHHSGYAGNIIKQIARQNLGSLATDPGRDLSEHLAIQANANDGAVLERDVGWRRLLDAVKEIAAASAENGIDLYYDVVKNTGTGLLELRTYTGQRGTDRSTTVVLSPELQTLASPDLKRDYNTAANRVIVAGTGQELWRNVVEVANAGQVNNSPWGYIKEHLYTTDQATTAAEAIIFGESYLRLNTNKITLSGTPMDTPAVQYGAHYGWGDKISIEFLGNVAVVSIDRVHVTVRDGEEQIQLEARGTVV